MTSNNERTETATAGQFMLTQRNVGFDSNDGQWVVTLLSENYWSPIGTLRRRRRGALIGIFATESAAMDAVRSTTLPPVTDEMVL